MAPGSTSDRSLSPAPTATIQKISVSWTGRLLVPTKILPVLCASAMKNGIRVVVDGVFNHTGREFSLSRISARKAGSFPYKDWYRGVNFGWEAPLGDPFGYEAWQGHFELPCLNLWNPEIRQYLFDSDPVLVGQLHYRRDPPGLRERPGFRVHERAPEKTSAMKPDLAHGRGDPRRI